MPAAVAQRRILQHIDLRVRSRERAASFYGAIFSALGFSRSDSEDWTSYAHEPEGLPKDQQIPEWFGFTEAAEMNPGDTRIAFHAQSRDEVDRIVALLPSLGARAIEPPDDEYGPNYYAVFFEDPDGNKLEVCFLG